MSELRPLTLADIASHFQVSITTVSKALQNKSGVSKDLASRINSFASELNYRPNFAARLLRTRSADTIGLLISGDIDSPWYSQLVSRLESALFDSELNMLLALGKNSLWRERRNLEIFSDGRVSGLIIGALRRGSNLRAIFDLVNNGLPLVAFNCIEELPVSYVAIDQRDGAKSAVEHLISCGHSKIIYLGCPPSESSGESLWARRNGFIEAMLKHNLPVHKSSFLYSENNRRIDGYKNIEALLSECRTDLPTAIFCHNDDMAIGAILALQQVGIKVPDDISLVGFDDISESSISFPRLTTIGGVMDELAQALVSTIKSLIVKPKQEAIRTIIKPKLIKRESVKNI